MPYIQGISESVTRRLNPYNIKVAHKPHSLVRSILVHVKGPIPTLQRRKVTYQIPCSCCDRTYTRQTGHLLGTRLKEHRGSVRRHYTNSCLAPHYMDIGHTCNWQDTCILGSGNSQRAREAIEALHWGEHAIRSILQANTFTALIGMPHPSSSPTYPTSLTYHPSPPLISTVPYSIAPPHPLPLSPANDAHLPTRHPPPIFQ